MRKQRESNPQALSDAAFQEQSSRQSGLCFQGSLPAHSGPARSGRQELSRRNRNRTCLKLGCKPSASPIGHPSISQCSRKLRSCQLHWLYSIVTVWTYWLVPHSPHSTIAFGVISPPMLQCHHTSHAKHIARPYTSSWLLVAYSVTYAASS